VTSWKAPNKKVSGNGDLLFFSDIGMVKGHMELAESVTEQMNE